MRYVSEDHDNTDIPVTYTKYNEILDNDTDHVVYYNERHAKISPV